MGARVQMKMSPANRDRGGFGKDKWSSDCTEAMVINIVMFRRQHCDQRNKTAQTRMWETEIWGTMLGGWL